MLDVLVLGPVEAWAEGTPLRLGGAVQRLLVARLTHERGRSIPVDRLANEVWGARSLPRDPAHALQSRISRLRKVLPVAIEWHSHCYSLDPAAVHTDADTFEDAALEAHELLLDGLPQRASTRLSTALELWRGPAFSALPHTADFHGEATRLEELRATANADRIEAEIVLGRGEGHIPSLQALVTDSPLVERHWHLLMLALYGAGRPQEAVNVFARARSHMVELAGTEPTPALGLLHRDILRDVPPDTVVATHGSRQAGPAPHADGRRVPTPQRSTTLSGRDNEWVTLDEAWDRARHGLQVAALSGEAGIGKTRLAQEFVAHLREHGTVVLTGRCDDSLDIAYAPFTEMLRSDHARSDEAARRARFAGDARGLAMLAPDLFGDEDHDTPSRSDPHGDTTQYRLFDAVLRWLCAASTQHPLCLVLDDFEQAGEETLRMLHHLLLHPHDMRVLLIVLVRTASDEDGARHPRLDALLRQSETVVHLALHPLDTETTEDVVQAELAGAADADHPAAPHLQERIAAASGGNPLFAVELARHHAASPPDDDTPGPPLTIPASLRTIIAHRVEGLPDDTVTALEFAAVGGEQIDPTDLTGVPKLTVADVDAFLLAGTRARLIEPHGGPAPLHRFCHDIVRMVVYDSIPPLKRTHMHLALAEAIAARHGASSPEHQRLLAYHYTRAIPAASPQHAVRHHTAAARRSLHLHAPTAAAASYRAAVDLLSPESDTEQYCDLLTELGWAQLRAGSPEHRDTLLRAARVARDLGDAARLRAAALANNRGWYSSTAAVDAERVSIIEAALATTDAADAESRSRLLASWAVENIRARSETIRREALAASAEAVTLAEHTGDDTLLGATLSHRYAVLYASFTDPVGSLRVCERMRELAARNMDPGLQLTAALGRSQASLMLADLATSDTALQRADRLATELQDPARLWLVRGWQAMRRALRGDLHGAADLAAEALQLGTQTEQPDATTWYTGQLFTLKYMTGTLPDVLDTIADQVATQGDGIPSWRAAQTLALCQAGNTAEGQRLLNSFVAEGFASIPRDMLWLNATGYLSQASAALGDRTAAEALYALLEPYSGMLANNGTIDAGPVDLHLAALASALGDTGRAERHRADTTALCARIDAPVWAAWVAGDSTYSRALAPQGLRDSR